MRKETFLITVIKWTCWSFVAGVGIANVLGPQEHEFMMKMWVLCGVFFALAVYLFFAYKELVKYTIIPALVILGVASYQWRFDTSNPDHIKNFIDKSRWAKTVITGTIEEDPDVREWITHILLKPESIITKDGERVLKGRTGKVLVFVSKSIREENPYYDNMEYGDRIEVTGALTVPMPLTNPYGFDYAKYLKNQNIYATLYVGSPDRIKYKGKNSLGRFGRIKQFSYRIKDRMILGLKKTVPPPCSAFIGGVTIGARGGVPAVMKYDFQATGVAHVLALSGLHVGFLAFMLIMIFNNLFKSPALFYRLPSRILRRDVDLTPHSQKLIPFFVIGVLFIFVVITGARPATVRASIMYSIGVVCYLWLGMSLFRTGSITIPVTAAIMLGFNSFLIYDASFALSFAAVWSIIYLSNPLRRVISDLLVGWGQLVFFLFIVTVIPALIVSPGMFADSGFIRMYAAAFVILSAAAYLLEKKYPLRGYEFEGWWPYISGFFCVQLSIQIGMMWPLSGVYFNRFPVAGILANFIAIPLIGIIVPLGLIGELMTLIPGVGNALGLAIGAANTVFSGFFLWMAEFFRTYFPYPVQSAPPARWLAVYFGALLVFAFNKSIRKFLSKTLRLSPAASSWAIFLILALILSSGRWAGDITKGKVKNADELLVTFLDVGYGNCALIQTPGGKTVLIDGGARGDSRFWTMGKWGKGQTVILPNLSGYNLSRIDKLISTNPLPENIGGLIYVLKYCNVAEIWDSLDPEKFYRGISYEGFLRGINDVRLEYQKTKPLAIGSYLNYYDFLNAIPEESGIRNSGIAESVLSGARMKRKRLVAGTTILREGSGSRLLEIKVISPPEKRISGTQSDLFNNSAVIRLDYGARSFLFASNIYAEGENILAQKYGSDLKADVLWVPDHGSSMSSSALFLDLVDPSWAVVQYGYLKGRSFYDNELDRTLRKYDRRGIRVYRTDRKGAVEIRCDGRNLKFKTVLGDDI